MRVLDRVARHGREGKIVPEVFAEARLDALLSRSPASGWR
jgi:hypothetical protein